MIERVNLIFYLIFVAEMLIKILALGLRNYMADRFNIFDFFIIVFVTLEIIVRVHADSGVASSGAFNALRALRLLRILKLAKSWTGL